VGKDCGNVWLNEEILALEFACAKCIAAQDGTLADTTVSPTRMKHRGVSAREIVRRKLR
jgi:hypothetical protein